MKCEFVAALLHSPQVIFLENLLLVWMWSPPKKSENLSNNTIRNSKPLLFLPVTICRRRALCQRVILIDNGQIYYDGELDVWPINIARPKHSNLLSKNLSKGNRSLLWLFSPSRCLQNTPCLYPKIKPYQSPEISLNILPSSTFSISDTPSRKLLARFIPPTMTLASEINKFAILTKILSILLSLTGLIFLSGGCTFYNFLFFYYLWIAIAQNQQTVGNYSFNSLISYFVIGYVVRSIVFSTRTADLGGDIQSGSLPVYSSSNRHHQILFFSGYYRPNYSICFLCFWKWP